MWCKSNFQARDLLGQALDLLTSARWNRSQQQRAPGKCRMGPGKTGARDACRRLRGEGQPSPRTPVPCSSSSASRDFNMLEVSCTRAHTPPAPCKSRPLTLLCLPAETYRGDAARSIVRSTVARRYAPGRVHPTPGGQLTPWTRVASTSSSASSKSRCAPPSPLHTLASPAPPRPHTTLIAPTRRSRPQLPLCPDFVAWPSNSRREGGLLLLFCVVACR